MSTQTDKIREALEKRKSSLDAALKYVTPFNIHKANEDDYLLVCEALAALSELEAQTPIDWKGIKVTKGQETHPLGTLIELLEYERDTALSELEAHPSEPRLTVDQLREEMELLGSMIRAERSTATEANRQCTDEQLERCYQLGDRLTKAAQ